MSNGFLRFLVQIARDWTDFWGFDGYFRCLFDIFGGVDGEGINKLINEGTSMSQLRFTHHHLVEHDSLIESVKYQLVVFLLCVYGQTQRGQENYS